MSEDLFAKSDQTLQIDQNKDYLAELVGENKPFKDNQALAKGKYLADQTVEAMKTRLDEIRSDYQKLYEERQQGATLKELIDEIRTNKQPSGEITQKPEDVKQPSLHDIKQEVISQLKSDAQQERELTNFQVVQGKLKEQYGENYQRILNEQKEKLRLSDDDVNAWAKKSPEAFFRLMGLDSSAKQDSFQAPPRSVTRNDNFAPTSPNKRTWDYYQKLKQKDRTLYYSPKIFNQMLKDAEDLGEAFKDGDYKQFGD